MTLVYEAGAVMDFGDVDLTVPQGDPCDLNPFNPGCRARRRDHETAASP